MLGLVPNAESACCAEGVSKGEGGVEWVSNALSAMALQAMLHVLQPATTSTPTTSTARARASSNSGVFYKKSQWKTVTKPANTTANSFGAASTAALTTRLLDLLTSRVEAKRAK